MYKLTITDLMKKECKKNITISNNILQEAIGEAEAKGLWLIYGAEKNGKTWFSLKLAQALAATERVAYVSAEEGTDKSFVDAVKRAGITKADNKLFFYEYTPLYELIAFFKKPKKQNIIIIDNATIYADELKTVGIKNLEKALPGKLIILIAHEERKEPYPASARMAKKMAKVIVNVKGLKAFVVSRFGKGGEIIIDEEKSMMYWGMESEN